MKKIPSLFVRDWEGNKELVKNEINPEAQWVFDGQGYPTRKWDGTAVMLREGKIFRRYDHKPLNWKELQKARKYGGPMHPDLKEPMYGDPPAGFVPAQERDPITMHLTGWLPVDPATTPEKHYTEAFASSVGFPDGTYELIGPKVNGNPEGREAHVLVRHGALLLPDRIMHPSLVPRDYDGLKEYLQKEVMEGIVFHHRDGRMAKIKARDFGIEWPRRKA